MNRVKLKIDETFKTFNNKVIDHKLCKTAERGESKCR